MSFGIFAAARTAISRTIGTRLVGSSRTNPLKRENNQRAMKTTPFGTAANGSPRIDTRDEGTPMDKEERIRCRAYNIWCAEGWPKGRDKEHWDRARREIENDAQNGQKRLPNPPQQAVSKSADAPR
jgi:hypothetical protein